MKGTGPERKSTESGAGGENWPDFHCYGVLREAVLRPHVLVQGLRDQEDDGSGNLAGTLTTPEYLAEPLELFGGHYVF